MHGMKSEKKVVKQFAQDILAYIVKRTIYGLQQITDTLSGDDSGLVNAWDEICVQKQYEESFYWDAYDEIAGGFVVAYVEELRDHEKLALWFQTDEGWNWLYDNEENDKDPPVNDDEVIEYIVKELYGKACNWSNIRIREYLDRSYLD